VSEFYEGLAEILEIEPGEVSPEMALEENAWDSLAIVSTIALIDEVYDRSVSADALADCRTVSDIEKLVASSVGA
jgi:acyl carrier protein